MLRFCSKATRRQHSFLVTHSCTCTLFGCIAFKGGMTCLCGDDYGQNAPDDECQVPCVGNRLQYCGGKNTVDGMPIYVVYTGRGMTFSVSHIKGAVGLYMYMAGD